MKNKTDAIISKLRDISKREHVDFQLILVRYFHERFLYRLSISEYKHKFLLKGGNLIYALQGIKTRPTKDIDFLGIDVRDDIEQIKQKIINICEIDYHNDSIVFDTNSLIAETITPKDKYQGIRLRMKAKLGNIKHQLAIDIGFGDVVIPFPCTIGYPVLLDETDIPFIEAYSIESAIAEKFQAMIELAAINSRMKDFYDIYFLLESANYHEDILHNAVIATFKNRNTHYSENHILFSDEFATNPDRVKMWKAFLKKISHNQDLQFDTVMTKICTELKPVLFHL